MGDRKMAEEYRKNPEEYLQLIYSQERMEKRGRLKIFFGYAAGVGKTYAMLEAAHLAKEQGVDVVCGYIEPHPRPKTSARMEGLEVLPFLEVEHHNITLREFDLDQALQRKPQLILVDELAHTNGPGCRHNKRYKDIKELLSAGIDVYTTVNVQHIESLNDQVAAITGILVRERIPDVVFDEADQVELVDIEPSDLLERLQAGNVYREAQAKKALHHFFTVENLTALREIALRRCADRVNHLTESARIQKKGDCSVEDHILVCLSSAPSNGRIIRTASRMVQAFHSKFTALYVETSRGRQMDEADKKRLQEHMHLAEQLGAQVETVYGEDVAFQIAEFARLSGISKIVIGRSAAVHHGFFRKPTLTEWLVEHAPNVDIHIIPDMENSMPYGKKHQRMKKKQKLYQMMKWLLLAIGALLVGFFAYVMILHSKGSIQAHHVAYMITCSILFLVIVFQASLYIRSKQHAMDMAQAAYRTKLLFETNQLMQQLTGEKEIIEATAKQLGKILNRTIVMYQKERDALGEAVVFPGSEAKDIEILYSQNERMVAEWVFANNKRAGATTDTLMNAKALYLAIRTGQKVYGVAGIEIGEEPLDTLQTSMLLSVLGECALALEKEILTESSQKKE